MSVVAIGVADVTIGPTMLAAADADPLFRQTRHFRAVIPGVAAARMPGDEGRATRRLIEASELAARRAGMVEAGP